MIGAAKLAQAISDRANPVVVKELRQAVQSRLVIAILLLFLLVNVFIVCAFLMLSVDAATNERAGQQLFTALFIVLVGTCMIFVPLYAAIRLTMERNDSNIDLLFITTIPPAAIIRGKFWSAVALTGLIYSTALPFLTLTYLLRGIDLPSIFISLAMVFLCNALTITLGIFVGSVAGGLLLRLLLMGGLLWVGGCIMFAAGGFGLEVASMGLASQFGSWKAWAVLGTFALVGLSFWGLTYLLAVAAVSARSSNRMFPIRVFVTVCWLVFAVVAGSWFYIDGDKDVVEVFAVVCGALFSVALCFNLAERESWTPRVRRRIPRSRLLRLVAWLFFTGAAGGVLWCFALGLASLGTAIAMIGQWKKTFALGYAPRDTAEVIYVMLGVLLFAWCYTMSGLLVRRLVVPKSVPLVGTTIALALLGIIGTLPLLVAYLVYGPLWRFEHLPLAYVIANPFVLERSGADRVTVFVFLSIWGILGLLANLPWFRHQWQSFCRYEARPVPAPAAPVTETPVPAAPVTEPPVTEPPVTEPPAPESPVVHV